MSSSSLSNSMTTSSLPSLSEGSSNTQTCPATQTSSSLSNVGMTKTTDKIIQAVLDSELHLQDWFAQAKKKSAQKPRLASWYDQCEQASIKATNVYKATLEIIKAAACLPMAPLQQNEFLLYEIKTTLNVYYAHKQAMYQITKQMKDTQPALSLDEKDVNDIQSLLAYYSL